MVANALLTIGFVVVLLVAISFIWSYAVWWALVYLKLISIDWNIYTWLAISIVSIFIGGIFGRRK